MANPHVKLFLSTDSVEGVFGEGKYRLLCAIRNEGSIQKAALSLGRSYRKAWGDIRRAEEGLGFALVTRTRGGASGGAAVVTERGKELLAAWGKFRRRVFAASDASYEKYLARIVEGSNKR